MIRFRCKCGRQLQAREEDAGRPAACPVCKRTTTVPEADEPEPRAAEDRDDITSEPSRGRPSRRRRDDEEEMGPEERRRRRRPAGEPVNSGMALTSVILGALSVVGCLFLTGIPAIITGFLAMRKIDQSRGKLGGKGMALTGLALGAVGLVFSVVLVPLVLLLPAVQKVRGAAARQKEANNLKMMGLAMHNMHDTHGFLPAAAAFRTKDGRPGLSWRVAILPYVEQLSLYQQFKLDEPWDSPHNSRLVGMMPSIYALPGEQPNAQGLTHYQVFVGPKSAFEPRKDQPAVGPSGSLVRGWRLTDFTDGTSNTILIATARTPVVWTKPDDLPFDPNGPLPALGVQGASQFTVLLGDGSTRPLKTTISDGTLRAAITRNGNELMGPDW